MANCPKCSSTNTTPKQLIAKKGPNVGKPFTIYECQDGCMNDDKPEYKYSFIPPKENNRAKKPPADTKELAEIKKILLEFRDEWRKSREPLDNLGKEVEKDIPF